MGVSVTNLPSHQAFFSKAANISLTSEEYIIGLL